MRRCVVILLLAAVIGRAQAPDSGGNKIDPGLEQVLGFEREPKGSMPGGWGGGPAATISSDEVNPHSGKRAARIERLANSEGEFSTITKMLPMDFAGKEIEFRGFVRTEEIIGFVGLWLREDGVQRGLAFDNMQQRGVKGTTDWTEYSIKLPVHPEGRRLYFGFLANGTGRAWVDDLQLLVDGKPIWEAPKAERPITVLERDHEFDAGSKVVWTKTTPVQVKNLATLGRVWGFLKYHHPKVTSGQVHWDYELFRIMPAVLAACDGAGCDTILLRWLDTLGEIKAGEPPVEPAGTELHLRPDIAWIKDEAGLGRELSQRLQAIYASRPKTDGQFYVSQAPGIGNPVFDHESEYAQIKTADPGYQLLALFRFWNIIRYWFPYRDLLDDDWDATLAEFIPRIGLAKDRDAYQLEMMALIAQVHDTHANLWGSLSVRPPAGDSQVPASIRFVGREAVVAGLTALPEQPPSGLQVGDVITAIDGVTLEKLIKEWAPYYAASNDVTRLRDMAQSLTRGPAGEVKLGIRRAGEAIEVKATRVPLAALKGKIARTHDLPGPVFRRLSPDVGYLKLSAVKAADAARYIEEAAGTKGLIIDIRNYPSEFMVFALGAHLVEKPTEFVRFTFGDLANPGAFQWTDKPLVLEPKAPRYLGRIVILIDEVSQSQAEYTTMAFRVAPNAIVVGSTTAGADGNVMPIPLPGGLGTMMSGIGVFYPDKRPTQRVGIIPDVEARPTIEGIKAGRDEVLEEALRQILGSETPAEEIRRLTVVPK